MEMETDELKSVCAGAEAVLGLQPNKSIPIAYHSHYGPHDDLILLELDEKLLPDVLHQRVTLRGQPDEEAVLCTPSKTYAIKSVGNSNSVLLIPPSDLSALYGTRKDSEEGDREKIAAPVIKVASGNLEIVEIAPKLDKLRALLSENPYKFDESSEMEDVECTGNSKYRWDDLIERVQASNEELRSGLQTLSAVEIDGYWRILDAKYKDGILKMLFHNAVLNDWSLSALNETEVVSVLVSDGYPQKLASHCLQVYGRNVGAGIWRIDEKLVCVHFATEILRGQKMKMEGFITEWRKGIPDEMHASFDMLEGEVLTEKIGIDTWVYSFSVSSLPSDPSERFKVLFRERPKWELKDLQPYIRDLKVPGLSAEGLLLKYTRRTQPTADAEPVLSAR